MDERVDPAALTFHQPMTVVTRVVIGLAGGLTFVAPWDLLIRPRVDVFRVAMIPFWAIALAALAIGLPLIAAAVMAPARTLTFDRDRRRLIDATAAAFGLTRRRVWAFAEIEAVVVEESTWQDGPSDWEVRLRLRARRALLKVVAHEGRAAAEADAARIRQILAD